MVFSSICNSSRKLTNTWSVFKPSLTAINLYVPFRGSIACHLYFYKMGINGFYSCWCLLPFACKRLCYLLHCEVAEFFTSTRSHDSFSYWLLKARVVWVWASWEKMYKAIPFHGILSTPASWVSLFWGTVQSSVWVLRSALALLRAPGTSEKPEPVLYSPFQTSTYFLLSQVAP